MRIIKRVLGIGRSKRGAADILAPTSLLAFAQMDGVQQAVMAEALVEVTRERHSLPRAS